jgi:hypothetical protein
VDIASLDKCLEEAAKW